MEVEVAIVGAGPVGATLACRLGQAGVAVALIDRAPLAPMEHPDFDGRAYAIAAGPRRVLDEAGLWDGLPQRPGPILDIRVTDGRLGRAASPLRLHFAAREAVVGDDPAAPDGAFGWMVEARSLRQAINARLVSLPSVRLFAPAEARVERRPEGATVAIAGGPTIACRLVVAAEGRASPLRAAAGIPVTGLPYGQAGLVFALAHARPHHGTALEHFLPGGPFAQLPLAPTQAEANLSSIVWSERNEVARRMIALDRAAFTRAAARRLGDHLGAVRLVSRRWCYPLSAMIAHRYTATRLALAGDAAHGVHPIAGQGLNLGFRDVACLARLVLAELARGGDPGAPALLGAYQAERRPDNMLMLAATHGLDRLFSNDLRTVRLVRDLGMAAVDRIPPLKRLFMRQAMGALMA
jgi:2-octaprenyl-6-methoxyphenol hydroxylase